MPVYYHYFSCAANYPTIFNQPPKLEDVHSCLQQQRTEALKKYNKSEVLWGQPSKWLLIQLCIFHIIDIAWIKRSPSLLVSKRKPSHASTTPKISRKASSNPPRKDKKSRKLHWESAPWKRKSSLNPWRRFSAESSVLRSKSRRCGLVWRSTGQ